MSVQDSWLSDSPSLYPGTSRWQHLLNAGKCASTLERQLHKYTHNYTVLSPLVCSVGTATYAHTLTHTRAHAYAHTHAHTHTHLTCHALLPFPTQGLPSCTPHQGEGCFCHERQTSHRNYKWAHLHPSHVSFAQRMQSCCDTWHQLSCRPFLLQATGHTHNTPPYFPSSST